MPDKDDTRSRPEADERVGGGDDNSGQPTGRTITVFVPDRDTGGNDGSGAPVSPVGEIGDSEDPEPSRAELSQDYLEDWRGRNSEYLLPEGVDGFEPTEDLTSISNYAIGEAVDILPDPREFSRYKPSTRGRRRL